MGIKVKNFSGSELKIIYSIPHSYHWNLKLLGMLTIIRIVRFHIYFLYEDDVLDATKLEH